MFTSRKAFSVNFANSAVRASVRKIWAVQKVSYKALARTDAAGVRPPAIRSLETNSFSICPGKIRSGQCA